MKKRTPEATVRVFIPATFSMLRTLVDDGEMPVRSGTAFAATPTLTESFSEGDQEEIEHVAFTEASRASLRLLQAEGVGTDDAEVPARRVVVSVELPDRAVTLRPDLDDAVVRLETPVVANKVLRAIHVDLDSNTDTVVKAVEAIDEADLGEEDAELTVGDAVDLDLAWFDPVELPFLVELG